MDKLLLILLLTSFSVLAGFRQKQKPLLLKSQKGVTINIEYSSESLQGNKSRAVDIHIEKITVLSNNLNRINQIEVYLNGVLVVLRCEYQICALEATKENLNESLFSQNVYFKDHMKEPRIQDIYASFRLNGRDWLVDPIRGDTYFKLMLNFPNFNDI